MAFQRRSLTPEEVRKAAGGKVEKGAVYRETDTRGNIVADYVDVGYNAVETYIVYDNKTGKAIAHATNMKDALQFDEMLNNPGQQKRLILTKVNSMTYSTIAPVQEDDYFKYGF